MPVPRPVCALGLAAALLALPLRSAAAAPAEQLSSHAFKKLVERTSPAVLRVISEPRGSAVLVGVGGEIIVDEKLVVKGSVAVEYRGERREAVLVGKDPELGLALLRLPADDYPAATVGTAQTLADGSALVGLSVDPKGALRAEPGHFAGRRSVKGVTRLRNDVAGPGGTALFNSKGQLVAIQAGRVHAAVAIEELKARFGAQRAP